MVYVWIQESAGSLRYVDDIYLPPCNKCGKRVSACECKQEKEKDNGQDGIPVRGDDETTEGRTDD